MHKKMHKKIHKKVQNNHFIEQYALNIIIYKPSILYKSQ